MSGRASRAARRSTALTRPAPRGASRLGQLDRLPHRGVRGDAVQERELEDARGAARPARAGRAWPPGGGRAGRSRGRAWRPLDGAVGELLGQRAVARVEPAAARLAVQRAVGPRALLEDAAHDRIRAGARGCDARVWVLALAGCFWSAPVCFSCPGVAAPRAAMQGPRSYRGPVSGLVLKSQNRAFAAVSSHRSYVRPFSASWHQSRPMGLMEPVQLADTSRGRGSQAMSDTDITTFETGRMTRPSALGDLRFAGTIAAGLVAGTLGLGALAAPLVGWRDWPSGLAQASAHGTVKLAKPQRPRTANTARSRGQRARPQVAGRRRRFRAGPARRLPARRGRRLPTGGFGVLAVTRGRPAARRRPARRSPARADASSSRRGQRHRRPASSSPTTPTPTATASRTSTRRERPEHERRLGRHARPDRHGPVATTPSSTSARRSPTATRTATA